MMRSIALARTRLLGLDLVIVHSNGHYANQLLRSALAVMTCLAGQPRRGGRLSEVTGLATVSELLRVSGEPSAAARGSAASKGTGVRR